jgi:cleavage and polyadenylation specificity factor subunit 5
MSSIRPKVDVHGHSNYVITEAESCRKHKDQTPAARLTRMKRRFETSGIIRSVEAVLLVHVHDHPHILLLEAHHGNATVYRLPGGKCRANEEDEECLVRKLGKKLFHGVDGVPFRVGELLSTWVRPHFDPLMYPYKPVHVAKEKEMRSVFLVHLDPQVSMGVPRDYRLVAVPLFDLYDNAAKYGSVVAGVPHVLSRLHINLC